MTIEVDEIIRRIKYEYEMWGKINERDLLHTRILR